MYKVQWTDEAELDLEHILNYYLDEAGERIARTVYDRVRDQIGKLQFFPERCRIGRVSGTKEYILSRLPYVAIVQIEEQTVYILNLIHTAKKFPIER